MVVAFICWSPFVAVIAWPVFQTYTEFSTTSDINSPLVLTPDNLSSNSNLPLKNSASFQSINKLQLFSNSTDAEENIFLTEQTSDLKPKHLRMWNLTQKYFAFIKNPNPPIFWLHFVSCIMTMAFTAISPYIYVFRSEKVKKCVVDLWNDQTCCRQLSLQANQQWLRSSMIRRVDSNHSHASTKERIPTPCPIRRNRRESTSSHPLLNEKHNDQSTSTNWGTPLGEKVDETHDEKSASQCDLAYAESFTHEKEHIRHVDKSMTTPPKTFSCPDVLKLPSVCLESSV